MADIIELPFHVVEMSLASGEKILSPLLMPEVVHVNRQPRQLAQSFQAAVRKHWIESANYLPFLKYCANMELQTLTIDVSFENAGSEFSISFLCYYLEKEQQYIGFVPVLGIESTGKDFEDLTKTLEQDIKLEFARKKRLKKPAAIIPCQWFSSIEIHRQMLKLEFYNPHELANLEKEHKKLLPSIADEVITGKETFEVEKELQRMRRAVQGKFAVNLLLVGPSGVGKTALIYELSRQKKDTTLQNSRFWETTASRLIQKLACNWQEQLHSICKELRESEDILFIRNFYELFEVGQYEGNNVSMGEYLREYIQRGEIRIVSECTEEEAALIEARVPGFLGLFQILQITESSEQKLLNIILAKVRFIAKFYDVNLEEQAVKEVFRLQKRYTPYSGFPGKSIRFLESLIIQHKKKTIDRSLVLQQFCEETGMPRFMVDDDAFLDIEKSRNFFADNVFGQQQAVDVVVDTLTSVKSGLTRRGKPIASFLFVGPTGVGKTEMAKVLAQFMFSNRRRITRFDMSEFSDAFSVMRLVGRHFAEEGVLTSAVRRDPFSVLLFDELEKADISFYDLLLQVLGEGRLTDSHGKVANFCSTIIIMTSNIGAKSFQKGSIGFGQEEDFRSLSLEHFQREVQKHFRPELFNRLDQVVAFGSITRAILRNIIEREITLIRNREGLKFRNIEFDLESKTLDYLCDKGYDARYGARQLQRVIDERLVVPMAIRLSEYGYDTPLQAKIKIEKGKLEIKVRAVAKEDRQKISLQKFLADIEEKRRHAQNLEIGHYFIMLLSKLDLLERAKRKRKDKFWKDEQTNRRYKIYLDLELECRRLFESIFEIEKETMLAFFVAEQRISSIESSFFQWQQDYLALKKRLYQTLSPESRQCVLGIYGLEANLLEIVDFYLTIFRNKGWEIRMHAVWFREEKYNEKDKEGKPKYQYVKTSCNRKKIQAEKPDDKLVGIEIFCRGECCFLYLEEEPGVHILQKEKMIKYYVHVKGCTREKYRTPIGIHRKQFFQELLERRTYEQEIIIDKKYSMKKTYKISQLQEFLDERMESKLDNLLIDDQ